MYVESIVCGNCKNIFDKDDLKRSCSNCFACFSCEIYICPICKNEIIVKPIKTREQQ